MSEPLKELAAIAGWMKNEIRLTERAAGARVVHPHFWSKQAIAKEGLRLAMRALPDAYTHEHADEVSVCYFLEVLANVLYGHAYEFQAGADGKPEFVEIWGQEGQDA